MDGERFCRRTRLTDCLHDEAAAARPWRPCALAAGRAGCTWGQRRRRCGRRPSGAGEAIFAQAAFEEAILKCVQLNYHQRTVHGHVDFHLVQSCSLTNISSAAPPSPPGLPVSMATHHQTKPSTLCWRKTPAFFFLIFRKLNSITANKLSSMNAYADI